MTQNSINFENWVRRKRARPLLSVREPRTSEFRYQRILGPRSAFAVVRIHGEPADEFAFESHVTWPCDDCTVAILDGILDELFANGTGHVVANVRFTLEAVQWDDVDSSINAYYLAARGAVREILGLDRLPYNIDSPLP
jgi:hypothetical protein